MAKLKTHKGIKKRFRKTAKGRFKCAHGGKGHILTDKKRKRKRLLRHSTLVSLDDTKKIRRALPYG